MTDRVSDLSLSQNAIQQSAVEPEPDRRPPERGVVGQEADEAVGLAGRHRRSRCSCAPA